MKKTTQKKLVQYFYDNIEDYSKLVLEFMKQEGYKQPAEAWIVEGYLRSEDHKPKVFDEIKSYRNFILRNDDYIKHAIGNINKIMDSDSEYMKLHPFEKFLSVYNSYMEVEKIKPNLGKEIISNFYKNN